MPGKPLTKTMMPQLTTQRTINPTRVEGMEKVIIDLKASISQLDKIQEGTRTKFTERSIYNIQRAIDELNIAIRSFQPQKSI
jgi:hypothetical protein